MSLTSIDRLAIVIVTYNRVNLLKDCLVSLKIQTYPIDTIFIIDNASTDGTAQFLENYRDLPLKIIRQDENSGGAGGFYSGVKLAFDQGFEWIFLMDDDVYLVPNSLEMLMQYKYPAMITVREDRAGVLIEKAALKYNLKNPLYLNPKRCSIADAYKNRSDLPTVLEVENVAFEGFIVHRKVVQQVGFPDPSYFIFYDDVDYALRIRAAGYKIYAIRDSILVRQLQFDQKAALNSWKAYFMFRNLFHIHHKFGASIFIKNKPYLLTLGIIIIALLKMNIKQVKDVIMAIRDFKNLNVRKS